MKRNEACGLLTMIASDELIDKQISRAIFKARDIIVCEPNKILDVMANPQAKKIYRDTLLDYIKRLTEEDMINADVRKQLNDLKLAIDDGFESTCEDEFLHTRCKSCKCYTERKNR